MAVKNWTIREVEPIKVWLPADFVRDHFFMHIASLRIIQAHTNLPIKEIVLRGQSIFVVLDYNDGDYIRYKTADVTSFEHLKNALKAYASIVL